MNKRVDGIGPSSKFFGVCCAATSCARQAAHGSPLGPLCPSHYQTLRKRGTIEALVPRMVSKAPEYRCWINMKSRCYTPSSTGFENYGGRGISVCDRWVSSFDAFLADMGPRPTPKHSVDRIDVNGNYEPANCRWASQVEQSRNTRVNHILHLAAGDMTLAEAVERSGQRYNTVIYRLKRGWPIGLALGRCRWMEANHA